MEMNKFHVSLLIISVALSYLETPTFASKKPYAVYLGGHSHGPEPTLADLARAENSHHELLGSILGSKDEAKKAMIYSHTKHINAFSAKLSDEEAMKMLGLDDVLSIFFCKGLRMKTTRSWEFLGLEKNGAVASNSLWNRTLGEDVIIANIDTGVWPDSESFKDDGMGPIPSKWKGHCSDGEEGIKCNKKLISVRRFRKDNNNTAMDRNGHGTHTLSTAGGRSVVGANYLGFANGTAKGGAPNARVASYKCGLGEVECTSCDFLAAMDEAIYDGVDVLSISIGSDTPTSAYHDDCYVIGALHAIKKGIVTVFAGGNEGPQEGTVTNTAPWMITVGASAIDRRFTNYVELGNKQRFKGEAMGLADPQKKPYPLVSYLDVVLSNATLGQVRNCTVGALDSGKVSEKILVIEALNEAESQPASCSSMATEAGAVGLIIVNNETYVLEKLNTLQAYLPTSVVSYSDGKAILAYIKSTKSPTAYITHLGTELDTRPAPSVSSYSSRGPNPLTAEILKPDIIAPGTDILAAYPPSALQYDINTMLQKGVVRYYLESGTSMAAPHVAGLVGLLKSLHPDWSPAMIKSAIMTTASTLDNTNQPIKDYTGKPATPFDMGAGHIQPNNAADPGLVYDLNFEDYLQFLCVDKNFTEAQLAKLAEKPFRCPKVYNLLDFNYPSITVPQLRGSVTVNRIITNVGIPGTYKVTVTEPEGIFLSVEPKTLRFGKIGEKRAFNLTLTAKKDVRLSKYSFGKLVWNDGFHHVTSPVVVKSV